MNTYDEIIALQDEYIKYLGDAYKAPMQIAWMHHFRPDKEVLAKGVELREKIAKAKEEWQAQQQPLSGKGVDEDEIKIFAKNANGYGLFGKKGEKYDAFNEGYLEGYKAATKGYTLKDIEDAFDAGMRHEYDRQFGRVPTSDTPTKEQYLSSINKK